MIIRKLLFAIITLYAFSSKAQFSSNSFNHDFFLKGGYGIPYAGYGLSAEWRHKKIGTGLSIGFSPKKKFEFQTLPSSSQFSIFSCYYFSNISESWQPRMGVLAGWVNRYNDDRIGIDKYDANVYSVALITGLEYSIKKIYFNFDITTFYGALKLPLYNNPYFDKKIVVSPSIGVGIHLGGNSGRPSMNIDFDKFLAKKDKQAELNKNYSQQIKNCIDAKFLVKEQSKNGVIDNSVLFSHIVDNQYVFVFLNLDSCKITNRCQNFRFNKNNFIKVYLCELSENDTIFNTELIEKYGIASSCDNYKAIDGWINIVSNQKILKKRSKEVKISYKIKNAKFVNNCDMQNEIYFDEIIVIDAVNDNKKAAK